MIQSEFLSALLSEKSPAAAVESGINREWFDADHRKVWEFTLGFFSKYRKMPGADALRRASPTFLFDTSLPEKFGYYADQLREDYQKRLLQAATSDALVGEGAEKPVSQIAQSMANRLLEIQRVGAATSDHDLQSKSERAAEAASYEAAKKVKGLRGIPTPWPELNEIMLGLQDEHMVTVAARPGTGKSWLLVLLAHYAAHTCGKNVLFISKEMSAGEIRGRISAVHLGIDAKKLRRGQLEKAQEAKYRSYLQGKTPIKGRIVVTTDEAVGEKTGTTLIRAKIETWRPDIVMVDGAYLLRNNAGASRTSDLYDVSQDMKRIAREYKVPCLVSIQQGRPKDQREAKTGGSLATLQWADAWGQDSDEVMELVQTETMKVDRRMRLRLLKQREGELVELDMHWDFSGMRFQVASALSGAAMTVADRERL